MANIIVLLQREVEKNNLYMDEKGNTITPEKIEAMAKKSYIADLKAGNIDFAKTFESYHADVLADYTPVQAVINIVKDAILYGDEVPDMPEPVMSEEVAN